MGVRRLKFSLIELSFVALFSPLIFASLIKMSAQLLEKTHRLERAHQAVFTKMLIQERLSSLLSAIEPNTLKISTNTTLSFVTHDLLEPEPAYSGRVPVTLSLIEDKLILRLFDRKELLMEGVESLSVHGGVAAPEFPSSLSFIRLTLTSREEPPFECAFFFTPLPNR